MPHGGQVEGLWGEGRGLDLSAESCIPPVNTAHCGQVENLCGEGRGLDLSAESCIPAGNSVLHSGQINKFEDRGWA